MKLQLLLLFGLLALVVADDAVNKSDEVVEEVNSGQKQFIRRPRKKTTTDDQLYREVDSDNYDRAITLVQDYISRGQTNVIRAAITKLLKNHKTSAAAFAYKLFAAGHRNIVEQYFPKEFKMVFSDSLIKFTNNRFNLPIDYDMTIDVDGDRRGQASTGLVGSNIYVWKLDPVIEGKKVYFKIRQNNNNFYLKLGIHSDGYGDNQAFGSPNSDTARHEWSFMPVYFNGQLMFCIVNHGKQQALKFGNRVYNGTRYIYGASGDYYNYPERYGWKVAVQ